VRIQATLMTTALAGIAVLGVLAAPVAGAAALAPGTAPATASAAAADAAAAGGALPIAGFHEMVADVATGHLFFSRGAQGKDASDTIVVTSLSGRLVRTIEGQTGVEGIALSPDGSTLYAALGGADAVSAINTSSLEVTGVYPLGAGNSPYDVAVESGRVWVSYTSKNGSFVGAINYNDIPSPSDFTPLVLPSSFTSAPRLFADPDNSGELIASVPGTELATVASYDVATSPVTMWRAPASLASCAFPADLAIVPGGNSFILSCGNAQQEYNTYTFAETRRYLSGSGQDAVAVAPNGTIALGARTAPNVTVFRPGAKTPVNRFAQTGYQVGLAQFGLAWSASSGTLFAVYQYPVLKNGGVSSHAFRVVAYQDPERTASTITLRGTTSAVVGHSISLTGRLTLSVGTPPARTTVTITRRQAGSAVVVRWTRTISSRGYFSLTNTPPSPGTYTYTASYAGTSAVAPTSASRRVVISRMASQLSLSVSAGTVNYRSPVTVTAHLNKALAGQIVLIYAQSFDSKAEHLLAIGLTNSRGAFSVRYVPTYSTTFTAVFRGNSDYQAATARRSVLVRAGVGESISGYTGSAYVGSTLYRVYQQTNTLDAASSVVPDEKGCVAFQIEQNVGGGWQYDTTSGCVKLTAAGRASMKYSLSNVPGGQFRIRADFRRSKDTTNVNGDSGWAYFLVVS
jgi:YVTN family beta-propeller protein